jgi:hypothetical protein
MKGPARWEWTWFRQPGENPDHRVYGSCWHRWAVCRSGKDQNRVICRLNGRALTDFDSLRIARRFCEAIDELTDWSRPPDDLASDRELGLAMHRIALRLSDARPALQIVTTRGGL